jgi:hypothetical protein
MTEEAMKATQATDRAGRLRCECGLGDVVWLADGTKSCTNTLERFRLLHGALPARWLPLTHVQSEMN